ncbi:hypothetical protein, partial [Faecalibaculum rodentium]|uniref:hypothetical protein n=1 Tax=Faecalibaculum rodentium TaxID=1702221 RepID=UPI00258E1C90
VVSNYMSILLMYPNSTNVSDSFHPDFFHIPGNFLDKTDIRSFGRNSGQATASIQYYKDCRHPENSMPSWSRGPVVDLLETWMKEPVFREPICSGIGCSLPLRQKKHQV